MLFISAHPGINAYIYLLKFAGGRSLWIVIYHHSSAADDIQAIYWVCVCLDFATCNSILILIFIPKVLVSSKEDYTATLINQWSRPIEGRVGKDPEFKGMQNDRRSEGIAIVLFGKPELEREILKLKALVESLQTRIQELIGNNSTRNGAAAATVDKEE